MWCQSDPYFFPSTLVNKISHNQLKKQLFFFTFGHSNHPNFLKSHITQGQFPFRRNGPICIYILSSSTFSFPSSSYCPFSPSSYLYLLILVLLLHSKSYVPPGVANPIKFSSYTMQWCKHFTILYRLPFNHAMYTWIITRRQLL